MTELDVVSLVDGVGDEVAELEVVLVIDEEPLIEAESVSLQEEVGVAVKEGLDVIDGLLVGVFEADEDEVGE